MKATTSLVIKTLKFSKKYLSTTSSERPFVQPGPTTNTLNIVNPKNTPIWPMFRVMDTDGILEESKLSFQVTKDDCTNMFLYMIQLQELDEVLYNAQRQGRISFYMQSSGEEGLQIGSAAALSNEDVVLAQYREGGVLLWRGFTVQQAVDQCFSNEADLGRGRQMPVHYGSRELNYHTVSSPLATQLPQAAGVAYALKADAKNATDGKPPAIACCYFGEGAASEGDFHAALNFASTLKVPMIFFCRNNGYAISTPTCDQFAGDGIISRAAGYGMHGIRVDGNDIFAVKEATIAARKLALEHSVPVLIEAMSYRRGHHSTSDDSTRYRSAAEIKFWGEDMNPITRLRKFMLHKGWWDSQSEVAMKDAERISVLRALDIAEKRPKPHLRTLFEDVYAELPPNLQEQQAQLLEHIAKYPQHYDGNGGH